MNMENNNRVHFQAALLGDVKLTDGKTMLSEEELHSDMVTKLLAYFLMNREKELLSVNIASELWQEEESNNPVGALKNLVYRLRRILSKKWPDLEFIRTENGGYRWNQDLDVTLDTEDLDLLQMEKQVHPETAFSCDEKIVDLYSGKFLRNCSDVFWVLRTQTHYQDLFLEAAHNVLKTLEDRKTADSYKKMEYTASKALHFDSFDEQLYIGLLKAYIGQGRQRDASEYYRKAVSVLYEQLGVAPGAEMKDLYHVIQKMGTDSEDDLFAIAADLDRSNEDHGVFYCDYNTFRNIYELETRRIGRLGVSVYLALITVQTENRQLEKEAFSWMYHCLTTLLRSSDVVTRYNHNQYLVLLTGCNFENAKVVLKRIARQYHLRWQKDSNVTYQLLEISEKKKGQVKTYVV